MTLKNSQNKKKNRGNSTLTLIMVVIGFVSGIIMGSFLDGVLEGYGFLLGIVLKLAIMFVTYYVQLIIHEAGHLVGGLISGYKFGSFRVGSLILLTQNGKLKLSRQKLAGTGGQCIMNVPPMVDGEYPVILYNLGGVLMNLITIPIFVLLAIVVSEMEFLYAFCVMMVLSAFIVAVTNGIPLKLGMVNNDGSNICELYRNKEAKRSFWCQFKVMEALREDCSLKDMPEEWFFMPSDEGMKNSITAAAAVFFENRLMAEGKFKEAAELSDKLLQMDSALIGLHINLLLTDRITAGLLLSEDASRLATLYESAEYQLFAKQMNTNISVIRTAYAYARLVKNDDGMAAEVLASFNRFAPAHPYTVEVESERVLIKMIDERAMNK